MIIQIPVRVGLCPSLLLLPAVAVADMDMAEAAAAEAAADMVSMGRHGIRAWDCLVGTSRDS